MTLFLASVRDEAEAAIALLARAEIIDLKEPRRGALGALDRDTTRNIVSLIGGLTTVSATIGDLPMHVETIGAAVLEKAACGVDYVKFGLFPDGDAWRCLDALHPLARQVNLILVLFADRLPDFDAVAAAAAMGAAGIMLDTADKSSGSLLAYLAPRQLANFVAQAKSHGLTVGLAGSLTAADVPKLLPLAPDLLGFRGALCNGSRAASLDPAACVAIRALIRESACSGKQTAGKDVRSAGSSVMLGGAAAIPTEFLMPMAEERVTRAGRVSSSGTGTDAPYDRVFVHDLVLDAEIGVYTHEKGVTQRARFSVDIEVTPTDQAIEDQIARVLDYDMIIDTIKDILAEGHINLVETLADEIASRCLAHPRAASVKVKIEKLDKEPGAVGVEIVRRRVRS